MPVVVSHLDCSQRSTSLVVRNNATSAKQLVIASGRFLLTPTVLQVDLIVVVPCSNFNPIFLSFILKSTRYLIIQRRRIMRQQQEQPRYLSQDPRYQPQAKVPTNLIPFFQNLAHFINEFFI